MSTNRLEAFSDGVLAIIITIMVLELRVPAVEGAHSASFEDLREAHLLPVFLSYVLSFIYLAIYWNNHHHMLFVTERVSGGVLWANMHLLFWLSLVPFTTSWVGEHPSDSAPAALYGVVLLLAAIAYFILQRAIVRQQGPDSLLQRAVGRDLKGKASPIIYVIALAAAFIDPWISYALYVLVAVIWLVPDRRIERALAAEQGRVTETARSTRR